MTSRRAYRKASDREDVVCRRGVIKNVKWRDAVVKRHDRKAWCERSVDGRC